MEHTLFCLFMAVLNIAVLVYIVRKFRKPKRLLKRRYLIDELRKTRDVVELQQAEIVHVKDVHRNFLKTYTELLSKNCDLQEQLRALEPIDRLTYKKVRQEVIDEVRGLFQPYHDTPSIAISMSRLREAFDRLAKLK